MRLPQPSNDWLGCRDAHVAYIARIGLLYSLTLAIGVRAITSPKASEGKWGRAVRVPDSSFSCKGLRACGSNAGCSRWVVSSEDDPQASA